MNIIEPTSNFDFTDKLYLGTPSILSPGVYFTPLFLNNKSVIVQTPPCMTKQGIKHASSKKIYTDLVFNSNDIFFIDWMENLELASQQLISKMNWFEKQIDIEELDTMFASTLKLYKSGKKYLLRANVKPNIQIYDQYTNKGTLLTMTDIVPDTKTMICILEIQGIKFTSQNFHFETEIKQIAVVSPDPYLDACFIKIPTKQQQEQVPEHETNKEQNEQNDLNDRNEGEKEVPVITLPVSNLYSNTEETNQIKLNTIPPSTGVLNDLDVEINNEAINEVIKSTDNNENGGKSENENKNVEEHFLTIMEKEKRNEGKNEGKEERKREKETNEDDFSMLSLDDVNEVKNSLNVSFNPTVGVQPIPLTRPKRNKGNIGIKIIEDDNGNEGNTTNKNEGNMDAAKSLLDFEDMNGTENDATKDEIEEITLDNLANIYADGDADANITKLKEPKQVYQEMLDSTLKKAEDAQLQAMQLFQEAEELKQKYGL